MKKYFKPAALLVLLVMICSVFSSCNALDEMRKSHAFWNNEDKTEILYNGEVYKKLSGSEDFLITDHIGYSNGYAYVTEKDVPLLLSDLLGTWIDVYHDGKLLQVGYQDSYYLESEYDEYLEKIKNTKFDKFRVFNSFSEKYELLSDEDSQIIIDIITQSEIVEITNYDFVYLGEIWRCDADMYFVSEKFELLKDPDGYYLGIGYTEYCYKVPEEMTERFEKIAKAYFIDWYYE